MLGINNIPVFLKDGFTISIILHIFFLILIMVSPYIRIHSFIPQIKYDEPIIVDLENLVIGKETVLPPAPSVKEEKKNEKPQYFKPEVEKEEETVKVQEDKTSQSENKKDNVGDFINEVVKNIKQEQEKREKIQRERMGGLDDLLASVDGLKKESSIQSNKKIETSEIDYGTKNYQKNSENFRKQNMALSYIDAVRIKLRSCWNIDPGAKDIKNMKIIIRASVSPDGNINSTEILNKDEYMSSASFKAVADSANRALIICSPYNLPIEYYKDWKDIVFTFYPDKKSVQ